MNVAARHVAARAIRVYQLTFSAIAGRHCRHLPTCSEYAAEAILRHGLWPGAWIGCSRVCRCGPGGTHGLDFVCEALPAQAAWYAPWRYARWRGTNEEPPRTPVNSPAPRYRDRARSRP